MDVFKEFSEQIDVLTANHKKLYVRIALWMWYHLRRWNNEPLHFKWVKKNEGEPVGEPMDVYHLTLHDMMPHEVCGQLTAEVLLKGRRINAFEPLKTEMLPDMWGKTTIQPKWVEA